MKNDHRSPLAPPQYQRRRKVTTTTLVPHKGNGVPPPPAPQVSRGPFFPLFIYLLALRR